MKWSVFLARASYHIAALEHGSMLKNVNPTASRQPNEWLRTFAENWPVA